MAATMRGDPSNMPRVFLIHECIAFYFQYVCNFFYGAEKINWCTLKVEKHFSRLKCSHPPLCPPRLSAHLCRRHGHRRGSGTSSRIFCFRPSSGEMWAWPSCRSDPSSRNIPKSPASQNKRDISETVPTAFCCCCTARGHCLRKVLQIT